MHVAKGEVTLQEAVLAWDLPGRGWCCCCGLQHLRQG